MDRVIPCPMTEDHGHRFHEGHEISRWELLLFCERCGMALKVDATGWTNIERTTFREAYAIHSDVSGPSSRA